MEKTLARTHKYFKQEEILLDLSSQEAAVKCYAKISVQAYAMGELSALIWLTDSKSLSPKGFEMIKWRMETLMDCLDGKLSYETIVPIPDFKD